MASVEPLGFGGQKICLRSYGRAKVVLHTSLETVHGRVRCSVLDLSLGGAQLQTDQAIDPGEALWLSLYKVRVFGTVQWTRGQMIGVQFEEKLPKALVLSLRGDDVDPKALEEVEAMLVAQDWAVGSPVARPKSLRIADVLGAPNQGSAGPGRSGVVAAPGTVSDSRRATRLEHGLIRQALLLIIFSAVAGGLIGIASALMQ